MGGSIRLELVAALNRNTHAGNSDFLVPEILANSALILKEIISKKHTAKFKSVPRRVPKTL